ncbi:hypothetical protein B0H19DRAFT_1140486 [Mycena capillaripes]|nr:hypothetical protein B0H19DRAFT_1140486 [Mycena capillaripes]
MPSTVAKLMRERERLKEIIRGHKAILSPIQRLPAELIMRILRLVPPRTFGPTVNELGYPPWRSLGFLPPGGRALWAIRSSGPKSPFTGMCI